MPRPSFSWNWGILSKLGSATIALATLHTADASTPPATPADGVKDPIGALRVPMGHVLLRREGDTVYISENGVPLEELVLTSPDGLRLRRLVEELDLANGPVSVPVNRVIIADGGSGIGAATRQARPKESETDEAPGK